MICVQKIFMKNIILFAKPAATRKARVYEGIRGEVSRSLQQLIQQVADFPQHEESKERQ
jgi:hypothetical protein